MIIWLAVMCSEFHPIIMQRVAAMATLSIHSADVDAISLAVALCRMLEAFVHAAAAGVTTSLGGMAGQSESRKAAWDQVEGLVGPMRACAEKWMGEFAEGYVIRVSNGSSGACSVLK